jgi:hypothetical protein
LQSNSIQEEIKHFDLLVNEKLKSEHIKDLNPSSPVKDFLIYDSSDNDCDEPYDLEATMPDQDIYPDEDTYDKYISAQVFLPRKNRFKKATVLKRKHDQDGNLIGHSHNNPILDTHIYEVVFPDGHILEYATDVIAENILAMVHEEGYETAILKSIVDH